MSTQVAAPAEVEAKPRYKLAMYWASACGGCDVAVLNLGMQLIEFTERWEPVFWPAAMDAKRADVRAMDDGEIDVCLFDGGIRTDEDAEMAHLLRAKSKVLVAFGSCAGEGCIPGLANQRSIEQVFAAAYDPELNDVTDGQLPNGPWESPYGELHLPTLQLRLRRWARWWTSTTRYRAVRLRPSASLRCSVRSQPRSMAPVPSLPRVRCLAPDPRPSVTSASASVV